VIDQQAFQQVMHSLETTLVAHGYQVSTVWRCTLQVSPGSGSGPLAGSGIKHLVIGPHFQRKRTVADRPAAPFFRCRLVFEPGEDQRAVSLHRALPARIDTGVTPWFLCCLDPVKHRTRGHHRFELAASLNAIVQDRTDEEIARRITSASLELMDETARHVQGQLST
jgi:hypothetical protein